MKYKSQNGTYLCVQITMLDCHCKVFSEITTLHQQHWANSVDVNCTYLDAVTPQGLA